MLVRDACGVESEIPIDNIDDFARSGRGFPGKMTRATMSMTDT
jgi:hypothetical protein